MISNLNSSLLSLQSPYTGKGAMPAAEENSIETAFAKQMGQAQELGQVKGAEAAIAELLLQANAAQSQKVQLSGQANAQGSSGVVLPQTGEKSEGSVEALLLPVQSKQESINPNLLLKAQAQLEAEALQQRMAMAAQPQLLASNQPVAVKPLLGEAMPQGIQQLNAGRLMPGSQHAPMTLNAQPWSRDWVMQGVSAENAPRGLFDSAAQVNQAPVQHAALSTHQPQVASVATATLSPSVQAALQSQMAQQLVASPELQGQFEIEDLRTQGEQKAPIVGSRIAFGGEAFLNSREAILPNQTLKAVQGPGAVTKTIAQTQAPVSMSDLLAARSEILKPGKELKKELNFGQNQPETLSLGATSVGLANAGHLGAAQNTVAPVIDMNAAVVPGAGARDRLSTDTLTQMSSNIRNLSDLGGGEMKIRLRPDHLGELQVRIATMGQDVSLKFHATDSKAKKILEESLSDLKIQLSAHHLSLGSVEVNVVPSAEGLSGRQELRADIQGQADHRAAQQAQDQAMGQDSRGRRFERDGESQQRMETPVSALTRAQATNRYRAAPGRLDVTA